MKRLNGSSDALEARHGTLPKTKTSSKRKTKLHSTRPRKNGYSRLHRRVCARFRNQYAYGQQERPAELETMRMSRNPTTVMTGNGEVQTRKEATVYVKELDLFVTVMLLEETPRSSIAREALRGSWVYLPLDRRSKNHIEQCAIRSLSTSGPKCET